MTKRELRKWIEELERRIAALEARPYIQPMIPYQPTYQPNYTGDPLPPWPIITC